MHVFDFSFAAAGAAGFGARVYGNLFATGMFSCGFPKEPPTNENSAGMPRVIIMIAFENLCNFRFCLDLFFQRNALCAAFQREFFNRYLGLVF